MHARMTSVATRVLRRHDTQKRADRILLWLAVVLFSLTPSVGRAATVYVESPMVKVEPSAPPKDASSASISAARNEFAAFQIVIHAGDAPIAGVRANAGDLSGPATVPAKAISLFRETLMNVQNPSGSTGRAGVYPDGLVPAVDEIDGQARHAFPFTVPAGESRAVWIDVLVPADAAPGTYKGNIRVTGDGLDTTVPVALEVYDFTLPSTPSLSTAFVIFADNVCLAHTGSTGCASPEAAAALVNKYQTLALNHRITLPNTFLLKPLQGSSDWSAFDSVYQPFLDGTASTLLSGARMTTAEYTWEKTVDGYRSLTRHFREKGWFERLFDYSADEPTDSHFATILTRHALVKEADPDLKILVTTDVDQAIEHGVVGAIDILAPCVNAMGGWSAGDQRSRYDSFLTPGRQLWMYQSCLSDSCTPAIGARAFLPSYAIDVSGVRNRLMQWADFEEKVSGELYYETAAAFRAGHPWTFVANGDGTLFYPGTPAEIGGSSDVPAASIRLKLIRQGVQDFEYLTMVSNLGDRALADQVVHQVLPNVNDATLTDPAVIEAARARLAKRIVELTGGHAAAPGAGCSAASGGSAALAGIIGLMALLRRRGHRLVARSQSAPDPKSEMECERSDGANSPEGEGDIAQA